MKKILLLLTLALMQIACTEQSYELSSEESSLKSTLEVIDGQLTIDLVEGEKMLLAKSPIAFDIDEAPATWKLLSKEIVKSSKTLPMPYGEFNEVSATYTDMICKVKLSTEKKKTLDGTLTVRLFDRAVAYQLTFDNAPEGTVILENGSWIPANLEGTCFATNGEHEPIGPVRIDLAKKLNKAPFIYRVDKRLLAFNECDLIDYPQINFQGHSDGSAIDLMFDPVAISGKRELPWRVVLVGNNYESLHNQKPIYQFMSREAEGDFSWVKPGLCMWDWRVKGTTFNGFTYKMNTESLKRYIDFCSKSNISYFLIDDEWCQPHNPLMPVRGLDLDAVVAYGKEKGVGIILYYDMTYVTDTRPAIEFEYIAKAYSEFGVAGIKYGFLKADGYLAKTIMTQEIIKTAAKYKLIIDFHDGPIPFSGLERTFPNYVNREYCHAQLDRRAAFNPRQFVKMACINLLAGHMDQTNGTYALNEMATRSKGPRNKYLSTSSAETARFLITHTGSFSVLIDAPEAYEQKADLFEVIASMPTKWDETKYLKMRWNSHIAVAKRSGERWFAGVVYNEKGGKNTLKLDFLEPNVKYTAKIFRDADDADYETNKEAYTIESREVTSTDSIVVTVPAGGGYSVIFEKK